MKVARLRDACFVSSPCVQLAWSSAACLFKVCTNCFLSKAVMSEARPSVTSPSLTELVAKFAELSAVSGFSSVAGLTTVIASAAWVLLIALCNG